MRAGRHRAYFEMLRIGIAALALVGACVNGSRTMSGSPTPVRAPDAGAFVILTNGHGIGARQFISANYTSGLFHSYAEHWVYQPRGGDVFGPGYGEMRRRLVRMLERRDAVDIYIYAHSNSYVELMEDVPRSLREKVRFVYNSGCDGAAQHRTWLEYGAKAYVGHPGSSCSQLFVMHFQSYWWSGETLHDAVGHANYDVREALVRGRGIVARGCRYDGESGDDVFRETAAQLSGDGELRIDSPVSRAAVGTARAR